MPVGRRALPVAFVLGAAFADGSGRHELAFYALLVGVPAVALAALAAFGDALDAGPLGRDETLALQALLWASALCLVVAGASTRAGALLGEAPSRIAETCLVACLGLLLVEGLVALVAQVRQPVPARRV